MGCAAMASVFFLAASLLQTLIMINGVAAEGLPSGSLRGSPEVQAVDASDTLDLIEMPDVGGQPDHPGPYAEEPNNTDAFKPKVANSSEEAGFCSVHQTGYWCNQSTRVRCCKFARGRRLRKMRFNGELQLLWLAQCCRERCAKLDERHSCFILVASLR